jgi:hypothetical protein
MFLNRFYTKLDPGELFKVKQIITTSSAAVSFSFSETVFFSMSSELPGQR